MNKGARVVPAVVLARPQADNRDVIKRLIILTVLCVVALGMVFPFIWMVLTSFKPESTVVRFPPRLWPEAWTLDGYVSIWQRVPFGRFFLNSLVFAGGVTLVSLTLDSLTAYALSRLRF